MSEITGQDVGICIDASPDGDAGVFRISAADDVLRLLADAHETEFSIQELVEATGVTRSTVWRAVDLLETVGAVQVRETPQRNYVSIDTDRLRKDDPILAIEQAEFRDPVRAFVERVEGAVAEADDVEELLGIVVFGSVARGEADRLSDVDVFVLVEGNRTSARRLVTDVSADLGDRQFDGDRYDFETYVESVESAHRAGSKLRELFEEGITVFGSERLQDLRKAVYANE